MKDTLYQEQYNRAYKYLESLTKDEKYYEIVEDSYKYKYGLILITYYDKKHEQEKEHFCINILDM